MLFVVFQQLFQQTPCFRQRKFVTKLPFLGEFTAGGGLGSPFGGAGKNL